MVRSMRVLSLRELNRATLARQLLLERSSLPVPAAIGQLVALQAQVNNPPYIGLWTRLAAFERATLTALLAERRIVRAAALRSTLHLLTDEDYLLLQPALQPALERALRSFFGKELRGRDLAPLIAAARTLLEAGPRTFAELRDALSMLAPDCAPDALAYAVRSYLPLVQVPPGGTWGSGGSPQYALAEPWLGQPLATPTASLRALLTRYLAAFGPATVQDFQVWAGMTGFKATVATLRADLVTYQDEQGRELLDLPDQPLPPAESAAMIRFIPEYDNLLIAHADRTRVIADADRPKVFLSAARVRYTILVDGFVRGTWSIQRDKRTATLVIEPFAPLAETDRDALADEGERLLRFSEDRAETLAVRFTDA